MCLSREVRLVTIGERGEAVGVPVGAPVGEPVDGAVGEAAGEGGGPPVRVRLDLLVLEGRPVAVGDVVLVDCGFALDVVETGDRT